MKPRLPGLTPRKTSISEHVNGAFRGSQPIAGHRQITDAYLVALAGLRDGVVATLDRAMLSVATEESGLVELLAE